MSFSNDTPEKMVRRKNDHIEICLEKDVESKGPGFSNERFYPEALPGFALDDVDTSAEFLGRRFSFPLLITGMTGGVERGQFINETLAMVAQKFNLPMGLGSQKMQIADPSLGRLFDVKSRAPEVFLIGNLGLSCFNYGVTLDDIKRLVESSRLDAFAFHLNALQEAIQGEGETNFSSLLGHLEQACCKLGVPVMVKEVGSGMTGKTALQLFEAGVSAVDVGGSSGTSWGLIEGLRGSPLHNRLGHLFRDWGLSTRDALKAVISVLNTSENALRLQSKGWPKCQVVATGGIRDGLDAAKAVALGASMAGVGLPFFRAVMSASLNQDLALQKLEQEVLFFTEGIRLTQFAAGAQTLPELRNCLAPSGASSWG